MKPFVTKPDRTGLSNYVSRKKRKHKSLKHSKRQQLNNFKNKAYEKRYT